MLRRSSGLFWRRNIKRAPAHSNKSLKLTIMTCVFQLSDFYFDSEITEPDKLYQVEVLDYNGEIHVLEIEASCQEEALSMAADLVPYADYAFVIGVFA